MTTPPRRLHIKSLPEAHLFLLLALVIGIFAGLSVVCFRILIEWLRIWLLGSALLPAFPRVVVVPAAAGLAVGIIALALFPRVSGSGVNQTKAAVYIYDGYIPFRTVVGKFITSAIAIGSGQSLGPEDPSLQIGAGLASLFGRKLNLSREKMRLVAPIGAAAGLAAAFNSPITAVLFVIEEVIGTWSAGVLGAILLAAVSATVVSQWFLGGEPLFRVPAYHLAHSSELIAYAILGAIGGFISLAMVKLVMYLRTRLRAMPRWSWYLQPAMAGLAIGIIGLKVPQVMGAGYDYIDHAMREQYTWQMLIGLALLKIVATAMSFSSGTPGGLFAPTLFIGAMLGAAVCAVERMVLPGITGPMGAYALIGMGTLFAGFLRAPMTSVFMIVEISGDYSIVLPVMISNTIAYLIARRFQHTAIFEVLSHQDGIILPSMEEQREAAVQRVELAMKGVDVVCTGADTVNQALARVNAAPAEHFLVALQGDHWTTISKQLLISLQAEGSSDVPLQAVVGFDPPLPTLHPDQPLDAALRVIHDRPLLPVVHRAHASRLVGTVTLEDVLEAYRMGASAA
ncbi:MAG: chloride channel protein [Betaproteobacteria bacterium]